MPFTPQHGATWWQWRFKKWLGSRCSLQLQPSVLAATLPHMIEEGGTKNDFIVFGNRLLGHRLL